MAEKTGPLNAEIWKQFDKALRFNESIKLADCVESNENFFIGKQWENLNAQGLPQPEFNMLKQIVLHQVASITSDNITMRCTPMAAAPGDEELEKVTAIINEQMSAVMDHNRIPNLLREYTRNAAVDGDGCFYSWFDPDADMGMGIKGCIRTDVLENTRVYFGNPHNRRVQTQPYILLMRREFLDELREYAEEQDVSKGDRERIRPDNDELNSPMEMRSDDRVTVITRFRKDRKTGSIWCSECTKDVVIRKEFDMGIRLYPITWLNWDYVQDCYHGHAMLTGLIPNQMFVNKSYAMAQVSLMMSAFPKVVYNRSIIPHWTNQVGAAVGVSGGDINNVAKILEPAQISPQVAQFINSAIEHTQSFTGATAAALGNTRPDNTSAIIALQRAASIPSELTKQNLYQSVEELGRIYVEFMAEYYGTRKVDVKLEELLPDEDKGMLQFAGVNPGKKMPVDFDFKTLKDIPMQMRIDVGASAYWSEIASMQTLDNLLMQNKIDLVDYLERLPEGYISKRQELIDKYKAPAVMPGMMPGAAPGGGNGGGDIMPGGQPQADVPVTRGYSELQRQINQSA